MNHEQDEADEWSAEQQLLATEDDEPEAAAPPVRYSPSCMDVWSFQLSRALLVTMTKRFGSGFAADVRREMKQQAERFEAGDAYDRAEAPHIRELLKGEMWEKLIISSREATEGQRPPPRW